MEQQDMNIHESISSNSVEPGLSHSNDGQTSRFPKKILLVIGGLIVVAELIWASYMLLGNQSQNYQKDTAQIVTEPTPQPSQTPVSQTAIVTLNAVQNVVKIGEILTVDILIDSSAKTDGSDLVIQYDPALLSVELTPQKTPVKVDTIYTDYPINTIDTKTGKITVAGVSLTEGGVETKGKFGSVTFKARKAGEANIALGFVLDSTVDSNVTSTGDGKDILTEVKNAKVVIQP